MLKVKILYLNRQIQGGRAMLKKTYSKARKSCRVAFELPPAVNAQTACVCGEFNA